MFPRKPQPARKRFVLAPKQSVAVILKIRENDQRVVAAVGDRHVQPAAEIHAEKVSVVVRPRAEQGLAVRAQQFPPRGNAAVFARVPREFPRGGAHFRRTLFLRVNVQQPRASAFPEFFFARIRRGNGKIRNAAAGKFVDVRRREFFQNLIAHDGNDFRHRPGIVQIHGEPLGGDVRAENRLRHPKFSDEIPPAADAGAQAAADAAAEPAARAARKLARGDAARQRAQGKIAGRRGRQRDFRHFRKRDFRGFRLGDDFARARSRADFSGGTAGRLNVGVRRAVAAAPAAAARGEKRRRRFRFVVDVSAHNPKQRAHAQRRVENQRKRQALDAEIAQKFRRGGRLGRGGEMPRFRAGTRSPLLFFRRGGNARDGGLRGNGIGGFSRGKISARPRGAHRRELLREGEHRRLLLDAVFFAFPPPLKFPQMRGVPTRQRTQILFGKGLRARRDSGRFRHRSLRSGVRMKLRRTARFFSSFVCVPAGTQKKFAPCRTKKESAPARERLPFFCSTRIASDGLTSGFPDR